MGEPLDGTKPSQIAAARAETAPSPHDAALRRLQAECNAAREENAALHRQIERHEDATGRLVTQRDRFQQRVAEAAQEGHAHRTEVKQLQDLLSQARQAAHDAQADVRHLSEANDTLRQEVELLRAEHDSITRARHETDNELLAVSRRNAEVEFELAELAQRTDALSSVEQEFSDVRAERDSLLEMVAQLQSEFSESHRKSVAGDAPDLATFEKEMTMARTLISSLEEQCRRTEHRIIAYRAEFQRERDTSERLRAALMRSRGLTGPAPDDAPPRSVSVRVNTVRLHVVERAAGGTGDEAEPESADS